MTRLTSITAILLVTSGSAWADGPSPAPSEPLVMPAAAPVTASQGGDWTGGYAGLQLGYGTADFTTDLSDYDTDGVVYGFHAGYLWDFGDWVLGPELQYDFTDLDIDSDNGSGSFDEIARLNLRAGRDLGRGLLYGSVGLAYANFDGVSGALSGDLDDPGWVVGFGYDYKMNESWGLGAQYQYHKFDDFGADGNDVDFGTIHLRASYRF